jgi:GTP-binding protein
VQEGLKFLILLTKSDKLTRAEANKALSIARLQCGGGEARLFSALKKQGLDEVAMLLWQWAHEGPTISVPPVDVIDEAEEPPALD